jgi:hypothetical protein
VTLAVRRPDDAEIVAAWSTSARLHPVDRALALLAAFVDAPLDRLSRLSPGQRDTLLCDARRVLFGAPLELVAACPACGEQNALDLDLRALPRTVPADPADDDAAHGQTFELGGRRFRLPDSCDLAAVAGEPDPQRAARALAQRCALDDAELDDAALAALDDALAERDAAAAVELRFACAACGAETSAPFDAATVLYGDVSAHVDRLLADVHRLASAYGWSEREILTLPAARRERYLALVG